jgi:hypothetical protein
MLHFYLSLDDMWMGQHWPASQILKPSWAIFSFFLSVLLKNWGTGFPKTYPHYVIQFGDNMPLNMHNVNYSRLES